MPFHWPHCESGVLCHLVSLPSLIVFKEKFRLLFSQSYPEKLMFDLLFNIFWNLHHVRETGKVYFALLNNHRCSFLHKFNSSVVLNITVMLCSLESSCLVSHCHSVAHWVVYPPTGSIGAEHPTYALQVYSTFNFTIPCMMAQWLVIGRNSHVSVDL